MPSMTIFKSIQLLKQIPRSGWIYAGVSMSDVESVADHTCGVTLLSMMLADALRNSGVTIDVSKTMRMAALHDLSESLTFDISKRYLDFLGEDGRRIKQTVEKSANQALTADLNSRLRREVLGLLKEHELGKTIEARTVAASDRLDLLMQLITYRRKGYRSSVLDEMQRKVTSEIIAMKNTSFTKMMREIQKEGSV